MTSEIGWCYFSVREHAISLSSYLPPKEALRAIIKLYGKIERFSFFVRLASTQPSNAPAAALRSLISNALSCYSRLAWKGTEEQVAYSLKMGNLGISTVGSARHSHCRGQEFESPMLHHKMSENDSVLDIFLFCHKKDSEKTSQRDADARKRIEKWIPSISSTLLAILTLNFSH